MHGKGIAWTILGVLGVLGCGPSINETRMVFAPPRPGECPLEFVQVRAEELAPGRSNWEILGYVTLQETGVQDPFAERYRQIVRPRACAMGGEAVTIMLSSATSGAPVFSGSAIAYAVLRRPVPAGRPAAF